MYRVFYVEQTELEILLLLGNILMVNLLFKIVSLIYILLIWKVFQQRLKCTWFNQHLKV